MEAIKKEIISSGQEHLLQNWHNLSDIEKEKLQNDLSLFNFSDMNCLFDRCIGNASQSDKSFHHIEALPEELVGSSIKGSAEDLSEYAKIGYSAIAKNQVALILLAGGQGTRLGVPYPKGMYDVGLPSHKTLYQLQAEKIIKIQENAKRLTGVSSAIVTWYIMTSEHTNTATEEFLKKNNYFGLRSENIVIFEQHMLPCFTFEGKIILETAYQVAKAPDGNGGLYRALVTNKILDDMERRGIRHLHIYGVDNILAKLADPTFIGFCMFKDASCGAKFVEKIDPDEAVGIICQIDDHFDVVEYSEISKETAKKRNQDGRLIFYIGNIVNHYLSIDFLKECCRKHEEKLVHHVAKKKIPFLSENGITIKPITPNGIKMEKYVFDVFRFAKKFVVWEVSREEEFSPLKNADGAQDSTPTTSRQMFLNLCANYVLKAGGKFSSDFNKITCEISPLVSYEGEDLEEISGKILTSPLLLNRREDI